MRGVQMFHEAVQQLDLQRFPGDGSDDLEVSVQLPKGTLPRD